MMGLQMGLQADEAMKMSPGELYSLYGLFKELHGKKEDSDE